MKNLDKPLYDSGPSPRELVLGATASMWSETADENSAESKIFPRLSALAERLWTDPPNKWTSEVTNRLLSLWDISLRLSSHSTFFT